MISQLSMWIRSFPPRIPKKLSLFPSALIPAALGKNGNPFPVAATGKIRWIQRRGLDVLGKPGVLGIGIIAVCLAFYVSAIIPVQDRLDAVKHDILSLHEKIRLKANGVGGNASPEEQLSRFYKIFPSDKSIPLWLGKMYALAQTHGISLDEGEYKVIPVKAGNLIGFQMTLPIKAEYPKIRQYLADLMKEIPTASLQNVQFERQKVGDTAVEAKVKMVLYVEQGS